MVHIIKEDLDKDNYYKYSGIDTTEEITCDKNLGYIRFKNSVITTKSIILGLGNGIIAGYGIIAGDEIKAGGGIIAGDEIKAGREIIAGWGIEAGDEIIAGWGIIAGFGIIAGYGIEAGYGIIAGGEIIAGWGIEAGGEIIAGLSIICRGILKFSYQLFAGTCTWRKTTEKDLIVECGKLETDGKIVLGNLIETGNKWKI